MLTLPPKGRYALIVFHKDDMADLFVSDLPRLSAVGEKVRLLRYMVHFAKDQQRLDRWSFKVEAAEG